MDELIPVFQACFDLSFYPLRVLGLDSFVLACPFLLIFVGGLFGLFFRILRRI